MTTPEPRVSDRRFKHFDPIPSTRHDWLNGGHIPDGVTVRTYESSCASAPYIWLTLTRQGDTDGVGVAKIYAHLPVEQAAVLRDQLTLLIEHHYQSEP